MRSSRFRRILGALLPSALRRDVFEPAAHDLRGEHLRSGGGQPHIALVFLFLRLPSSFLPNEDQGRVSVQFRLPAGATQRSAPA